MKLDSEEQKQKDKQSQSSSLSSKSSKKIALLKRLTPSKSEPSSYKFDKERIVLGSVVSADVRLTGEGISPIHAVMEFHIDSKTGNYQTTIFDLASDTGVFVNSQKVITKQLQDGDEIKLGSHRFSYSSEHLLAGKKGERTKEIDGRTLFLNPQEDLTPLILEDEREIIEIFDYRPSSKPALEVVMSWSGAILDVQHFIDEKKVTVGSTQKNHFAIPSILPALEYPLTTQNGGNYTLNLDRKMTGVFQKKGQIQSLEEVRNSSQKGANGYEVALERDDFAKIQIGEIDFYLSFTSAPPRLKRRKLLERDPFFNKVFFFSLVMTAGLLFILSRVKLQQSVDAEQVPERIATILYQPEKFMKPPEVPKPKPTPTQTPTPVVKAPEPPQPVQKPRPVPTVKVTAKPRPPEEKKPLPKVMDVAAKPAPVTAKPAAPPSQPKQPPKSAGKEGEGAKAKGPEGSRGEANKTVSAQKVTAANRPSPTQGTSGAQGRSQIADEGNVDILKGAGGKIQNILGNSAANLGEGSKSLKGFGNFSTQGNGGLALSGSGQGGGGTADTTLGGLGKKGSGMGKVGTGKGAIGTGTGIVGSSVRVDIRTEGPEEAVVMGGIDRDAIAEAIYAHKDEFRLCYEREINAENPNLSGQVGTSFVIGSSGRVTQSGIESSSLKNPNTERCVLNVLKRIQFPMPRGGGVVEVHFPFKFSAVGK